MRLFVALDIEEAIRQRIVQFMKEVRGYAPDVRWVSPESMHVTLKFIGEVPDDRVRQIEQELKPVGVAPLQVSFCGHGFFPTARSARVFWVGIEADPGLARLASQVDDALEKVGVPKEKRAFSPHLTLARAGSGSPSRQREDRGNRQFGALQIKLEKLAAQDFGSMTAREFFLYRSQLSSKGSVYTKIARFALQGEH